MDGVSITIQRGETWALVGESGSGKTTLGRTILRLGDPTGGDIVVDGQEITRTRQGALRPMRARMQMIFQDPVLEPEPSYEGLGYAYRAVSHPRHPGIEAEGR